MEQPMLSVDQHKDPSCDKATPNVLPCRIQHDGPVSQVNSYWKPSQEPGIYDSAMVAETFTNCVTDGKRVVYFRGRKLHGRALRLPEGYRGAVVDKTEPPKPQEPRPDEPEVVDLEAEDEMPLGALETKAEFDEIVIWGHESVADTNSDPYVRGVDEWIKLAEKVTCWASNASLQLILTDMFRYMPTRYRSRGSELLLWGGGWGFRACLLVRYAFCAFNARGCF